MKYYGNKKFDLIVTLNALNTHQPRPYAGRLGGPWLPIRAASVPKKYGYGLRGHGGPPAGPPNNPPCVAMLFGLWGTHRGRANLRLPVSWVAHGRFQSGWGVQLIPDPTISSVLYPHVTSRHLVLFPGSNETNRRDTIMNKTLKKNWKKNLWQKDFIKSGLEYFDIDNFWKEKSWCKIFVQDKFRIKKSPAKNSEIENLEKNILI